MVWDALVQGNHPIEPGRTILRPFFPNDGSSLPDKVEVIAGIWADGESFGQPEWLSNILKTRAMRASEYDDATAILQKGWTRIGPPTTISRPSATNVSGWASQLANAANFMRCRMPPK
jgi:hypothetical protein